MVDGLLSDSQEKKSEILKNIDDIDSLSELIETLNGKDKEQEKFKPLLEENLLRINYKQAL